MGSIGLLRPIGKWGISGRERRVGFGCRNLERTKWHFCGFCSCFIGTKTHCRNIPQCYLLSLAAREAAEVPSTYYSGPAKDAFKELVSHKTRNALLAFGKKGTGFVCHSSAFQLPDGLLMFYYSTSTLAGVWCEGIPKQVCPTRSQPLKSPALPQRSLGAVV